MVAGLIEHEVRLGQSVGIGRAVQFPSILGDPGAVSGGREKVETEVKNSTKSGRKI